MNRLARRACTLNGGLHFRAVVNSDLRYRSISGSTIGSLQNAFRDPSSPFHLPPGTTGPDSPDPPPDYENMTPKEEGLERLTRLGYDPGSLWEQAIVWGDHDAFHFSLTYCLVRFFESSRIEWMTSLGHELGGPSKAKEMISARGVSMILKSISLNYKRPVVYPDTLLIAHKPHLGPSSHSASQKPLARTHFHMKGAIWSYAQRAIVTDCDSVIVWYDYDKLKKCDPGPEALDALKRRMQLGQATENLDVT